jgi:hypothetical protein
MSLSVIDDFQAAVAALAWPLALHHSQGDTQKRQESPPALRCILGSP